MQPHRPTVLCAMLPGDCLVTLRRLRMIGAPAILTQLVVWVYLAGLVSDPIDGAEFFAGDMAITTKVRELGYSCFPYEIKFDGITHDINSDAGFVLALVVLCRVKLRGIVWFGIVCSTWVFMSRSTTGRDVHCPLGRPTTVVAAANKMTSRVMLLFWLAHAKQCFTVLEQPSSSLMYLHPRFQELIGLSGKHTCLSCPSCVLSCSQPNHSNHSQIFGPRFCGGCEYDNPRECQAMQACVINQAKYSSSPPRFSWGTTWQTRPS
jgi:hypothetical protein